MVCHLESSLWPDFLLPLCAILSAAQPRIRAPNVSTITTGHPLEPPQRRAATIGKPIVIERGVWIAACAIIIGGVTIGEHSVVAAGSVVTKDVPVKTLSEETRPGALAAAKAAHLDEARRAFAADRRWRRGRCEVGPSAALDVVGYSRLRGDDEAGFETLLTPLTEIRRPRQRNSTLSRVSGINGLVDHVVESYDIIEGLVREMMHLESRQTVSMYASVPALFGQPFDR